jgi:aspartate-semialdehyde dehydrogenase
MGSTVTVAVAGATGAIGAEIVAVLDRVRWRPEELLVAASPTSAVPFVDYGDDRLPVEDVAHLDTGACDAVILALPAAVTRAVADRATADGAIVVDTSGELALDADVPIVVPWINPDRIAAVGPRRTVATPLAEALLLASILGPLARAGVGGEVHATVLVPASAFGRAGIDELSRQVAALFNAGTPPRKIFPTGLAFDLIPLLGEVGADGWAARERAVAGQVAQLVGPRFDVSVTLIGAPVFSGVSADIGLRLDRRLPPDLLQTILTDGGVRAPDEPGARYLPRPRRVEGQPFAQVARVRAANAESTRLQLWAAADNLRATATCAVTLVAALLGDRLRDDGEPGRR